MEKENDDVDDKTDFKQNLTGYVYQLKLLLLFLWRGFKNGNCNKFLLGTELKEAEKFDDAVLFYEKDGITYVRYMQAKYSRYVEELSFNDFESGWNGARCNLKKYFISFRKIKQKPYTKELHDLIICTNIAFGSLIIAKNAKNILANCLTFDDISEESEDEMFNDMKKYQLHDIKTAPKIHKELQDCTNLKLLVKELINCIFRNKKCDLQNYWTSAFFNVLIEENVIEEREFYKLSKKIENPQNALEIQKNQDIQEFKNFFIPNENVKFEKNFIYSLRNQKGPEIATIKETAELLSQHVTHEVAVSVPCKTFDKFNVILKRKFESYFVFTENFINETNLSRNANTFRNLLMKVCQKEIAKNLDQQHISVDDALNGIKKFASRTKREDNEDMQKAAKELIDHILYKKVLKNIFENNYSFLENVFHLAGVNTLQFAKEFLQDSNHKNFREMFLTMYAKEKLMNTTIQFKQDLIKYSVIVKQMKESYNEIQNLKNSDIKVEKILKLDQTDWKNNKMEGLIEALNGSIFVATNERDKIEFKDIFTNIHQKMSNKLAERFKKLLHQGFSKDYVNLRNYKIEYMNYPPCFEELKEESTDINDDIETFREKMCIVTTPNETDLMDKVAEEMGEKFNLLDADNITFELFQEILKWAKEKEDKFLSEDDANSFMENISTRLSGKFMSGCNILYLNKLNEYLISYNNTITELKVFLELHPSNKDETKILHLQSNEILLTTIKVLQTVKSHHQFEKEDYFIISPLTTLIRMEAIEKHVSKAFSSRIEVLIIVEKTVEKSELRKFCNTLSGILKKPNKRIVIISAESSELISFFKTKTETKKFIKAVSIKIEINDLNFESKQIIRQNTAINFQGKDIVLDELMNEEEFSTLIDAKTLQEKICGEKMIIGKPVETFTTFEKACYRSRQIRLIEVDERLFKEVNLPEKNLYVIELVKPLNIPNFKSKSIVAEEFIRSNEINKEKYFIVLKASEAEKQFHKICEKRRNYCIHWLKAIGEKVVWFHSHVPPGSSLKVLEHYISQREEYISEAFFEEYIPKNRAIIIADKAGMGKSTLLTNFSRMLKHEERWILRINLNQYTPVLETILKASYKNDKSLYLNFNDFNSDEKDYAKVVLNSLITPKTHTNNKITFENRVFSHFFTTRGILYIFDGFDEINPDYGEIILLLINILHKNENNRIWIASRKNFKHILEEKFNTFAYDLKPFDKTDQEIFLKQYWIGNYKKEKNKEMPNQGRLNFYIKEVLKKATEKLGDIIGIPLQTKMFAEVLQENNEQKNYRNTWISCFDYVEAKEPPTELNISSRFNLTMLYEKFFKEKIGKYYLYGKGILERSKPDSKDHEKMKCDNEYSYHKIFGFFALVNREDKHTLLAQNEIQDITKWYKEFNEGRKKMGIIDNFKNSATQPLFNHFTYAEYFAATFLFEKLITAPTKSKNVFEMVNEIFEKDVRVFTECFLLKLKQNVKDIEIGLNGKSVLNFVTQYGLLNCITIFLQVEGFRDNYCRVDESEKTILHYAAESENVNAFFYVSFFIWRLIENPDIFFHYLSATLFKDENSAPLIYNSDIKLIYDDLKKGAEQHVKFKKNSVPPKITWKTPVLKDKKFIKDVITSKQSFITRKSLMDYFKNFSYQSILVILKVLKALNNDLLPTKDDFVNDIYLRSDITMYEKIQIFESFLNCLNGGRNAGLGIGNTYNNHVLETITDFIMEDGNENILEQITINKTFKFKKCFLYKSFKKRCNANVLHFIKKSFHIIKKFLYVDTNHLFCVALSTRARLNIIQFLHEKMESSLDAEKALFVAVKHDCKINIIKYLVENGAHPKTEIKKGKSAWTLSLENNNDEIIQYFLQKMKEDSFQLRNQSVVNIIEGYYNNPENFDLNQEVNGNSLLHQAIAEKNITLCKFLINKGSDIFRKNLNGKTALECAMEQNLEDVIKLLIVTEKSFCHSGIKKHSYLVSHKEESKDLNIHLAAKNDDDKAVISQLYLGVPYNILSKNGETFESAASRKIKALYNEINQCFNDAQNNSFHFLRKYDSFEAQKFMNTRKYENGKTLLHYAIENDDDKAVKQLLYCGASIFNVDNNNRTPVFYAIEMNNKKMLTLILTMARINYPQLLNTTECKRIQRNECTIFMEHIHKCCDLAVNEKIDELKNEIEVIENNEDLNLIFSLLKKILTTLTENRIPVTFCAIATNLLQKGINVHTLHDIYRCCPFKNLKLQNLLLFLIQIAEYILSKKFIPESIIKYYNCRFTNFFDSVENSDSNVADKIIANARFNFGKEQICGATLLHIAAIKDEAEIVDWLIKEKNADPNNKTHNGQNVYDLAKRNRSKNVLALLQQTKKMDCNKLQNYFSP